MCCSSSTTSMRFLLSIVLQHSNATRRCDFRLVVTNGNCKTHQYTLASFSMLDPDNPTLRLNESHADTFRATGTCRIGSNVKELVEDTLTQVGLNPRPFIFY